MRRLATALLCLPLLAPTSEPAARRLAPPEGLSCPRDQLTVYEGKVLAYRRDLNVTQLRIRTDSATTETVRIAHPGTRDPRPWFLLARAPFTVDDWPRIETAPGRLRPGLRVAAWVCGDGSPPVIDWQLPPAP